MDGTMRYGQGIGSFDVRGYPSIASSYPSRPLPCPRGINVTKHNELLDRIATALECLADALLEDQKIPEDDPLVMEVMGNMRKAMEQGLKEWDKVTDLERRLDAMENFVHFVDVPPRPAHDPVDVSDFMDAPPTVGDGYGEEGDMPAFGTEDYDPEVFPEDLGEERDDVWTCPNCGNETTKVKGMTWKVCGECHHPIPPEEEEHAREDLTPGMDTPGHR